MTECLPVESYGTVRPFALVVLSELRHSKAPLTAADLARRSRLRPVTVRSALRALQAAGLVAEAGGAWSDATPA